MKLISNNLKYIIILCAFHFPVSAQLEDCNNTPNTNIVYYVAKDGKDYKGDGSYHKPWRTIDFALYKAEDKSTIMVKPGIYEEQVRIKKEFKTSVLIKAEIPYQTKFTYNARIFAIVGAAKNITIEGFEFTHKNKNASPVLVHIDGFGSYGTPKTVSNITLRNNIFHDSYNNDLLKINNGAKNILVECNMFYNQGDSDEHIDVNSVENVKISNNIFFNDFKASNRKISYKSSSFIVVKDSNDNEDKILGSDKIVINGNIFFNWQGTRGHGFILIGEDGKPYYEAKNIEIFNNLLIGNSLINMRSPLGVKGAKNIKFFNNTITGDLPSNAYAIRVNREGKNPINQNISLYNNIWNDTTGTMGIGGSQKSIDFSDVLYNQLDNYTLNNNLIFNGLNELPSSFFDVINPADDKDLINKDPLLFSSLIVMTPIWLTNKKAFNDGSLSIREAFTRLAISYGKPQNASAIEVPINTKHFPTYDIMGNTRHTPHSVGAYNIN